MNESKLSQELYKEFHRVSRSLTYLTVALVAIVALFIWLFEIDIGGKRTTLMGVMFMILAVFTYQIPYFSYRYMTIKYKHHNEKSALLGTDWKQFRDAAMLRK